MFVGRADCADATQASIFNGKPKAQLYTRDHNEFAILNCAGATVRGANGCAPSDVIVSKEEYSRLNGLKAWFEAKKSDLPVTERAQGEAHATKKEKQLGEVSAQEFFDVAVKVSGSELGLYTLS
jgi:hypothetical protein